MKKACRRWLTLFMALCLAVMMLVPVMATDTMTEDTSSEESSVSTDSEDLANGVMQVWLEYVDDNGTVYQISGGSCFLINDEYVLTNYHVLNLDEEYGEVDGVTYSIRDFLIMYFGLSSLKDDDSHLRISVYGYRDASVTASIVENCYSETTDFAALKLSDKIGGRTILALGDSDTVKVTDTVTSYGFPSTSIENKEYNSAADVSVTIGNVSKVTTSGSIDYIEHTANINTGNSGGPLIDEDGLVVGINSFMYTNYLGENYYAIQINTIKNYLDNAVISYTDGSSSTASSSSESTTETTTDAASDATSDTAAGTSDEITSAETTEEEVDKTSLKSAIDDAQEKADSGDYTSATVSALESTIEDAQKVYDDADATAEEVAAAESDLSMAVSGLEQKSFGLGSLLPIIIIAAAVVVIIVVIIIVVMNSKKKKKQAGAGYASAGGGYGGAPIPPAQGQAPSGTTAQQGQRYQGQQYQSQQYQGQQYAQGNDGSGETTLLDSGAGETTLLGGGGSAYLIRRKNGEKIMINSASFAIGKERKRVTYCISDNTSISRLHAVITKRGADYYIADQQSSNFTYVNGVQLSPMKQTLLTDRTVIKLADEEFEFHLA